MKILTITEEVDSIDNYRASGPLFELGKSDGYEVDIASRNFAYSKIFRKYDIFCYPEGHISCFSGKAIEILSKNCNADLLGQYHEQDFRIKYFPFLKLSTGSYFLRKY